MKVLLLDTNVVSILFKPDHSLRQKRLAMVTGHQWFISFMARAELLLWLRVNGWGSRRREELIHHVDLCATLYPDETRVSAGPTSWPIVKHVVFDARRHSGEFSVA
jgi:predicted nucleic acid-binding protein